jgi:hypothetical protein
MNIKEIFTSELISSIFGLILGFLGKLTYDKIVEVLQNKPIKKFFKTKNGGVIIIHSAIFDQERNAYDYPACDTKVARLVASSLNRIGLKEDTSFEITTDNDLVNNNPSFEDKLKQNDLILICSPKRNKITKLAIEKMNYLRYTPLYDNQANLNFIRDNLKKVDLISSEDRKKENLSDDQIDYGLLISANNPFNIHKRIVIISGNHGEGTLGVAEFLSSDENIRKLLKREEQGKIEELFVVKYREPEIISAKIMS